MDIGGHLLIPRGSPLVLLSVLSVLSVSLIIAHFTIFSSFSGPKLPEPF